MTRFFECFRVIKMEGAKMQNYGKSPIEKWAIIKEKVFKRDGYMCRLIMCLTFNELGILENKVGRMIIDPAHIFKVGSHPHIKFIPEYIVTLNRYSHNMLDSGKCPLTGKIINQEEVETWWRRIVGNKLYNILKDLIYKSEKEINNFFEENYRD